VQDVVRIGGEVVAAVHPRDALQQCMDRIYRYRMTTTSGGNVSLRGEAGETWITPARIDKGALRREDIVEVRPDGTWSSEVPPSSELPLHRAIYRARPDVNAVLHAHRVALVAFSAVHQVPNTRVLHQAIRICGDGGFAPYELPGSAALGERIAETLTAGVDCVVLENHGVVTVGSDLDEAFRRFETFEFVGKTIVKAGLLGRPLLELPEDQLAIAALRTPLGLLEERPARTLLELELRRQLEEFVRRGYRQRLFISAHGTFSARLAADSFLITPHHADRANVDGDELVLIADGKAEPEGQPSHAALLHHEIYRRHPEIQAVINAAPVNATAFSLVGAVPDTRTIPESHVVVRAPQAAPFRLQFERPAELAALISPQSPTAILANSGVLVTGASVLEAFDRLEVLESTAEALVNARALGEVVPISDEAVRDLDEVFP
jgi:L-fuculose-phosphate aldolase